jgi:small-conductance mechanosensitive channel|tara:strand:+ start:565 stop:1086 length:522 start_codon:yes stop_codon:yes gene_type:complete
MVSLRLKNNKRGQVQDILVFMLTIFSIAIFATVLWQVGDSIQDGLENSQLYNNDTASSVASLDKTAKMGDTMVGLVFIGLLLTLLISAVLVPTHIIWTVIYLVVGVILWFMSIPLSNAYSQFIQSGSMSGMASNMPLTNQLMTNLPIFTTIILMLLIVILYGKRFLFTEGGGI